MKRVAAIDCGTNSLRLLVADLDRASGEVCELDRRTTIVRLGQDVDHTRSFAPEALRRTYAVLDDYARAIRSYGVGQDDVRCVATSAARDVSNREDFVRGVAGRLGVEPDIISGGEEAELSYGGATRGLVGRPHLARPVVVVDIGGGSTEVVTVSTDSPARLICRSLDIGSVRLTERHLHTDPPTPAETAALTAQADKTLDELPPQLRSAGTLVGVAGTVTTVAAMAMRLATYDRARIHHAFIVTPVLLQAVDRVVAMSVSQRKALGFMDPGRADVIGGGALILAAVVRRLGASGLLVSESDILDGIAWSLA